MENDEDPAVVLAAIAAVDEDYETDQERSTEAYDLEEVTDQHDGPGSSESAADLAPNPIRRNYTCRGPCKFTTKNPRQFLYHRREHHRESISIYECPHCIYASKQLQKLERHMTMVHKIGSPNNNNAKIRTFTSPIQLTIADEKRGPNVNVKMTTRSADRKPTSNGHGGDTLPYDTNEFHMDEIYPCSTCDHIAETEAELEEHEVQVHREDDSSSQLQKNFFCCPHCDFVTNENQKYERHMRYHSTSNHSCPSCGFSTNSRWHLDKHMKNHDANGLFKCDLCTFSANSRQSITAHKSWHHPDKTMTEDSPSENTEDGKMQEDMDVDEPVIDPAFYTEKHIKPNSVDDGDDQDIEIDDNLGELKSLSCRLCNSVCKSPEDLSRHMNIVHHVAAKGQNLLNLLMKIQKSPEADVNGSEDGDAATNNAKKDDLKNMIGGNAKEPMCLICGYKAKWVSEVEKHMRIHTQEKPFPCPYCDHSARWKGDLNRHITKIHPEHMEEFYEKFVSKRRIRPPKPFSVHVPSEGQNKMVFPGMEQPGDVKSLDFNLAENNDDGNSSDVSEKELTIEYPSEVNETHSKDELDELERPLQISLPSETKIDVGDSSVNESQMSDNNNKVSGTAMTLYKKVKRYIYKCLSCEFTSRTASRFHVHIVQHLNRKPYMCSECGYRSNWEWDITKHIKMKIQRSEGHDSAKVLLIDEAGRKNYEKYNKYRIEIEEEVAVEELPKSETNKSSPPVEQLENIVKNSIKVSYKCRSCNFKDSNKRFVINHIISHLQPHIIPGCGVADSRNTSNITTDSYTVKQLESGELFFCSICPYKTQRNAYIKFHLKQHLQRPGANYKCHFCPFWANFRKSLVKHFKLHVVNPNIYLREVESLLVIETPVSHDKQPPSLPKIMDSSDFCSPKISVITSKVSAQDEIVYRKQDADEMAPPSTTFVSVTSLPNDSPKKVPEKKKFFCEHCPYDSDNRTQYLYHKQFHRPNRPGAHKCRYCSYSVSHLHLLRQHMKVHKMAASNSSEMSSDSDTSERKSPPLTDTPKSKVSGWNNSLEISALKPNLDNQVDDSALIPSVWVKQGGDLIKMYKCRYCPLVNKRRANVRVHELMHTKGSQSKFICPLCNYQCNNQGVLTAHIKIHQSNEVDAYVKGDNGKKRNSSNNSKLVVYTDALPAMKQPSNVPPHLLVSMPGPRPKYRAQNYRCSKCPGIFKSQHDLDNHLKFHGLNLPFLCDICDYSARCKPHLHNHLRCHTENWPKTSNNESPNANAKNSNSFSFSPSSTSSPSVTITPMPQKRQTFSNPEQNALLVEEANSCNAQLSGFPGHIICSMCPAKFKATYLLQFHKALHGSAGQYKCSRCTYAVSSSKNINCHAKLHSGQPTTSGSAISLQPIKPYKCPKCPASFGKIARLHRHFALHGAGNRHVCDKCDYSVKFAANLMKHKQVHRLHYNINGQQDENSKSKINAGYNPADDLPKAGLQSPPSTSNKLGGSKSLQKPLGPFQQQVQNKEWLQESVCHVIAEDVDPKSRIFRCDRCPYVHGRKDAVQNHLRRHVAYQGLCCPHCDYYTMHMCFMRDHIKLHYKQSHWMKQHNFTSLNGMEITAICAETGQKTVIFSDHGVKCADRFVPDVPSDEEVIIESNDNLEELEMKSDVMDGSELIASEQELVIGNYREPSLQQFKGLSMVPSNNSYFDRESIDGDDSQSTSNIMSYYDDSMSESRDYAQAMQNVEKLGYEDVIHAIDKFMKNDYVPVKEKLEESEEMAVCD